MKNLDSMFDESKVIAVVGGQWGDEGKGKFVDCLAKDADIIARGTGGNNAGHTVVADGNQYIFHLLPSSILHEGKLNIIGNGTVIDPNVLFDELDKLSNIGRYISEDDLVISGDAHVILPYHIEVEAEAKKRIGTTGRGIGPAYMDKAARCGIRVNDLVNRDLLKEKIKQNLKEKKGECSRKELTDLVKTYSRYGFQLQRYVGDTRKILREACGAGKKILGEGAQGTLLSIDHGTYPMVTSSESSAAGLSSGIGLLRGMKVLNVVKAYTTRVGNGPFPTEINGALENFLRRVGGEYGATTGRPRRCGWLDAVALKHVLGINGNSVAISKLDVLDNLKEIKICTHYEYTGKSIQYNGRYLTKGDTIDFFPTESSVLEKCKPVYSYVQPGWQQNTDNKMPKEVMLYLSAISTLTGARIEMVSYGPEREKTLAIGSGCGKKSGGCCKSSGGSCCSKK